jgi:hypothetical protein
VITAHGLPHARYGGSIRPASLMMPLPTPALPTAGAPAGMLIARHSLPGHRRERARARKGRGVAVSFYHCAYGVSIITRLSVVRLPLLTVNEGRRFAEAAVAHLCAHTYARQSAASCHLHVRRTSHRTRRWPLAARRSALATTPYSSQTTPPKHHRPTHRPAPSTHLPTLATT